MNEIKCDECGAETDMDPAKPHYERAGWSVGAMATWDRHDGTWSIGKSIHFCPTCTPLILPSAQDKLIGELQSALRGVVEVHKDLPSMDNVQHALDLAEAYDKRRAEMKAAEGSRNGVGHRRKE